VRSRHQQENREGALVPIIWLAFYAITVVGALAWSRHAPETPELATINDGVQDVAAEGKMVWK
jgi:hypothetical protein